MQWEYGKLRSNQLWIAWVTLATGILAVPLAWLLRNSLMIGRAPLPSWTVLTVGVVLAIAGLSVSITLLRARSRPPKLITIHDGKLTLPGGLLAGAGWSLPVAKVTVRTTDIGFVKQIHLSGKRKRTTLSSALFANNAEFERLVNTLSRG
ncbi:hypothetical protein [Stieleria neptunia]|uniref:hypothetical protein n=1 Tax=Stieleria neptunia TaxID=2527979 RepID=UPI0011A8F47E|nr:hypothetical protein [Stieleria neptunia]